MLTESLSSRMPPMNAVPPSGTSTVVVACCVETEGIPGIVHLDTQKFAPFDHLMPFLKERK